MRRIYMLLATAALATQVLSLSAGSLAALADEREGCTGFSWSLDAELDLMTAPAESLKMGAEVQGVPDRAVEIALSPTATTTLPFEPGIKPAAIPPSSFSGWLRVADVPAGTYQVTINHDAWIDAVQGDVLIGSAGFTGSRNCKVLHKSVRYNLQAGPVIILLSGVTHETVKVTLRRAD